MIKLKLVAIVSLLVLSINACAGIGSASNAQVIVSAEKSALDKCISAYNSYSLKGDFYDTPIDRVYVYTKEKREFIFVLFTDGAAGLFDEKDSDYQAILACGLTGSKFEKVYQLTQPPGVGRVLIYNKALSSKFAFHDTDFVRVSLYIRVDNNFVYKSVKVGRLDEMDIGM